MKLENDIEKIVEKYFYDRGHGRCIPAVTYSEYDIKKYTFRMSCQTYNCSADYCMNENTLQLNNFRKEIRAILKQNGFTKCKFDTTKVTIKGGAFGDYRVTRLNAIYFDK